MADMTSAISELTASLTLEDKVALLTGRDFWNTVPIDKIGLRNLLLSDGPSGVRGEQWDERIPSLNLPSSSALSAAWSPELAARYGKALASEARSKGVDVVLGPTINLHRSPHGGRHFECMSEDPLLTGHLASAYVSAIQAEGVGACPKHYIANDFETDRFTVDVVVDDRTLRELYLLPFEMAVVEAEAWSVMSSYNSINGATATENDLLDAPLRTEWGFDGAVISDWTAVRSLHSAEKEQDLVMPGPVGPWGDALVAAVRAGEIDESIVDRKVDRLLLLAARVGALDLGDTFTAAQLTTTLDDPSGFSREAAAAGMVLVSNDGVLPLDLSAAPTVAVIGHNARDARTQGGGSATVLPEVVVSPLDGIRTAVGASNVRYEMGAIVEQGITALALDQLTNPVSGAPGVHSAFFDADGTEIFTEDRRSSALVYFGGDAPIGTASSLVYRTVYRVEEQAKLGVGFHGSRPATLAIDGVVVVESEKHAAGSNLGASFLNPKSVSGVVDVSAGQLLEIEVTVDLSGPGGPMGNALGFTFGTRPSDADPAVLIASAVEAAKASDIAVVVVGTNAKVESEGYDRSSLDLPGEQDALVAAVAAANPRTIVVVNSGSPVVMPWRDDVAAVLLSYFPGQSFGSALTDVLFGDVEPGGRLPTTWPAVEADVPVTNVTPVDGVVAYEEGIHIGYRAWLKAGVEPAYPFGFGLGYTTWSINSISGPEALAAGEDFTVDVEVANTGGRSGRHVVQVYAERPGSTIDRPVRWLVGFADVSLDAGATATVPVQVRGRSLAHWDGEWSWEPGEFTLRACNHAGDSGVAHSATIR